MRLRSERSGGSGKDEGQSVVDNSEVYELNADQEDTTRMVTG